MSKKDEDKKALKIVGNVLLAILKIIIFVCLLLPLYIILVTCLGVTVCYIAMIFNGITYYSPLVSLLAVDAFILFFTYLFTKLIIDGDVKVGVLLFHFTNFLVFSIAACILIPIEVSLTKYINDVPDNYKNEVNTYKISNKNIIDTNHYYVKYVVDKKAKNSYKVEIKQNQDFNHFEVEKNQDGKYKFIKVYNDDNSKDLRKIIKTMYDNIKDKKVYNYSRINNYEATIYANQKTIDKIKKANSNM